MPLLYINLLTKLYDGQQARIQVDTQSDLFEIKRGTKQGDPISPILFISVLEHIMRKVKEKWAKKYRGIQIGTMAETRITNLRFADDILLIARTLPEIRQMIADIIEEGGEIGLELHPEKTKIQHNNIGYGSCARKAKVQNMDIEILPSNGKTTYLGRALSLTEPHDTELDHRIRQAWAKFGKFKSELTDKDVPLHLRLKLFNSVVTPTVLYGCVSWTMIGSRIEKLRTTQMKMLLLILGRKRLISAMGEIEAWVEWI